MVNPLQAMASGLDSNQTNFFVAQHQLDTAPAYYTELCTALYERELFSLANTQQSNIARLQQRLKGLSYHIRRAAYFMASNITPLALDTHNATWTANQRKKNPALNVNLAANQQWLSRYSAHGLVVCVWVQELSQGHIELDSIDRVLPEKSLLHTNKHGWFTLEGKAAESESDTYSQRQLCRPNKTFVTAACCGHQWNHKGPVPPRPLTLREILLASTINWTHFRTPYKQLNVTK